MSIRGGKCIRGASKGGSGISREEDRTSSGRDYIELLGKVSFPVRIIWNIQRFEIFSQIREK